MKINTNHPTFISFVENVNSNILTYVNPENYFTLPKDKKVTLQYMTIKMVNQLVKSRAKLTNDELKEFVEILRTKNEELENYEFASLLNDVILNFDLMSELNKPAKRTRKGTIKTDTSESE